MLDKYESQYHTNDFIKTDPVVIPHLFTKQQDIEISGFFAATLAWGQRKTIIKKCQLLMELMAFSPYDFIMNHSDSDLAKLEKFAHRTFNFTDLLYFIHFLRTYFRRYHSLEDAFLPESEKEINVKGGIEKFYNLFISDELMPPRTKKHVASPNKKSACKRLNMFLRWMVRIDDEGIDFGIWRRIKPHQLVCPCDVHVERVARSLGLITRKSVDWAMAEELTNNLKLFDSEDPVKYDYALFSMGLNKYF